MLVLFIVGLLADLCTSPAVTAGPPPVGRSCEIGLHQCAAYETCVGNRKNNRSRIGECQCVNGYVRSSSSGQCQPTALITNVSDTDAFVVMIDGPTMVILPVDDVNMTAVVTWPDGREDDTTLKYIWTLKNSPDHQKGDAEIVSLEGRENRTVHIHGLQEGNYTVEVRVSDGNNTVRTDWALTVTVAPEKKQPPMAVIQPPFERVNENTQIILDGSASKDEDGTIVEYAWSRVDGPVSSDNDVLARTPTLTLSGLHPGNYSFRLTVKDSDGMESAALSKVYVSAEVDYPPKAIAGSCDGKMGDVAVRLPVKAVFLCGNVSTDDKRIVKWKWTLKDTGKNTADMEGTGSAMLKVSNLHVGDYTFMLTVEDEKGQSSSADIHVVVMPEFNKPPVSNAGQNQTIRYPETSVILDGGLSSDDKQIEYYQWSQVEGPSLAVLTNEDKARMTAADLQPGVYVFELNVTDDDGLSDVDRVFVTVDASDNKPPVPVAADVNVSLPCNVATLNASSSWDDAGVVRWLWTVHDNSPAGLDLLGMTWQQPVLLVSNLAMGAYVLNLTVFDKQGAAGGRLVKLNVVPSDKEIQTIEIQMRTKLNEFTMRRQRKLTKQLQALLETNPAWDRVNVIITKVASDPNHPSIRVFFYAIVGALDSSQKEELLPALAVVSYLESHSLRSEFMSELAINRIDTLHCQNNCSGRGHCDEYTKQCVCDRYWMPNLFSYYSRGIAKDCNWSVLYFVLVLFLSLFIPAGVIWCIVRFSSVQCCWRWRNVTTRTKAAARRIKRYRMLKDQESVKKNGSLNLKAFRGRSNGHVPVESDSDLSSEEETVYDRSSLLSKHQRDRNIGNGVVT